MLFWFSFFLSSLSLISSFDFFISFLPFISFLSFFLSFFLCFFFFFLSFLSFFSTHTKKNEIIHWEGRRRGWKNVFGEFRTPGDFQVVKLVFKFGTKCLYLRTVSRFYLMPSKTFEILYFFFQKKTADFFLLFVHARGCAILRRLTWMQPTLTRYG